MSGTAKTTGSAAAAEVKPKVDLGLLEEDDEFEEFPTDSWTGKAEEEDDIKVWEDNWDDDNVEDDFSLQLRAELDKQPGAAAVKTEPAQKK